MALIDEVVIQVQSGTGGNGCISFRREKYVPFGGPNGGNGGAGGDVYLEATRDKTSLLDFKFRPKFEAERGEHGLGKDMFGRAGAALNIALPVGTLVYDEQTGLLLHDLTVHGERVCIARGGRGGRGNLSFKTSTNRAPRTATNGEVGEIRRLKLELRLLADIGLIGKPNAGKSSFLRAVSRATPKVADYPFTTLEPHLGVVDHKGQGFVVADLPGLIEGASEGVGLGHKFLRHVSRNRLLLHLVEGHLDDDTIEQEILAIRAELEKFDPQLASRPQLLVFTKADLLPEAERAAKLAALAQRGYPGWFISSHSGAGMSDLLDHLSTLAAGWKLATAPQDAAAPAEPVPEPTAETSGHSDDGGSPHAHWG
jgi:GTP-binding protein